MRLLRRRWLLAALLVLLVAAVVGAVSHVDARYVHARGMWCVFHGWRAWSLLRRHHPGWGAYHLWRAARTCRPAPWRY